MQSDLGPHFFSRPFVRMLVFESLGHLLCDTFLKCPDRIFFTECKI